jgi:hypothetical protein
MNCVVCDKKLRIDNTIGTCRKHRALSKTRQDYEKSWQVKNKEKYTEAKKRWARNNPQYFRDYRNSSLSKKIAHALRTRLRRVIKFGSAVDNLGCSVAEVLAHLESKFVNGMNWNNYGKWHIDHIKPLSSFDLTDPNQLALACNYKNLQPLWAADNIRKSAKLDYCPKSARHPNG